MKRIIAIALSAALACAAPMALTACGGQETGGGDAPAAAQDGTAQFATLGDVFAAEPQDMSSTFDEQRYVCGFSVDGTWWRVEAALEEGMSDKIDEVWVDDEEAVKELLSPLAVTRADAFEPLDAAALEALTGKTGADLAADGFTIGEGMLTVNGDQTDCTATNGAFDYLITFDGAVDDENTSDPAGAVADMTVVTVGLQGMSWTALEAE